LVRNSAAQHDTRRAKSLDDLPVLTKDASGTLTVREGSELSEQEAAQEQRIAELQQQHRAAPAAGLGPDKLEQLKHLGELRQSGIPTDKYTGR